MISYNDPPYDMITETLNAFHLRSATMRREAKDQPTGSSYASAMNAMRRAKCGVFGWLLQGSVIQTNPSRPNRLWGSWTMNPMLLTTKWSERGLHPWFLHTLSRNQIMVSSFPRSTVWFLGCVLSSEAQGRL